MIDTTYMRTWAEIDLDALAHNYRALRAMLPVGCRFLGLCKANAYGHGADRIGPELERLGADILAVACVDEAIQLRRSGVSIPILCLGQTPAELTGLLLEHQVTQTVENLEAGKALSAAASAVGGKLKIHVKVDTGMSRLGFLWQDGGDNGVFLDQVTELLSLPGLRGEGMFTHFANADGDEDYTMTQFTRFLDARQALEARGYALEIYHCAASAAMLNYPCTHLDMARPGLALYGHYPAPECEGLDGPGLLPVMTVKSRIAAVRELPMGTPVSYGCTQRLERDSRLAVIPIGYGDGYPRRLSGRGEMRINGVLCPIVGRVCMDMCMVDVTDLPQVRAGDIAVVYDGELMERAAALTDTITYELMCDIAPRIPRVYKNRGTDGTRERDQT